MTKTAPPGEPALNFNNEFFDAYLEYTSETESPSIYHLWSAVSGIGACLGRRVHIPFGISPIYANQFVLLVGPPAVRKTTAINYMRRRLEVSTAVRYAPDDTGGKRQGLITAIKDEYDEEDKELTEEIAGGAALTAETLSRLREYAVSDPRDKHSLYVTQSEFSNFIGQNETGLTDFLIKMYDGENYDYQLRKEKLTLDQPLISLIGGTTPTSLAKCLPPEAIGGGFMSRFIFVYANAKRKSIPWPIEPDPQLCRRIELFCKAFNEFDGELSLEPKAFDALKGLYGEEINIPDPRFVYYRERRHSHLIKTSMVFAVARLSHVIELQDVVNARALLSATEIYMPEALGEFGLSPLASAKQKMLEFIQSTRSVVSEQILWAVMHRDMRQVDFQNAINDLINARQIERHQGKDGPVIIYVEKAKTSMDEMVSLLEGMPE